MTEPWRGTVSIEVSAGELVDRITILEIKSERIDDASRLGNVEAELTSLRASHRRHVAGSPELVRLTGELRAVNEALWEIEDDIREHERRGDFGPSFVALARSVYRTNDRRAALKREIDDLLGSRWREEKSYAPYDDDD